MKNLQTYISIGALCTFAFVSLSLHGQREYNYVNDWRYNRTNDSPREYKIPEGIKQMTISVTDKKGSTGKTHRKYDEYGNILELTQENGDGKLIPKMVAEFRGKDQLMGATHYGKGKLEATTKLERNESGFATLFEERNHKGKLMRKDTWFFNGEDQLTESFSYNKGGETVRYRWTYEYVEGKKSKSILQKGDGTIINIWTFDCDAEGEKLEKKEATTQVCQWSKEDGLFLVKVYQKFDEKGKLEKHVRKFTLKDTLPVEFISYDHKDRLSRVALFDRSYDKILSQDNYYKGKLSTSYRWIYVEDQLAIEEHYFRGALRRKKEFSYANGHIEGIELFDGKMRFKNSSVFDFVMLD